MSTPTSTGTVGEALDGLVSQFSSAAACFRELVQNSIDAGSLRIDVWTEFIPSEKGLGTICLHVDDSGEGMDEQIIDEQLTRLFASSKENDLTKIGKFGIGFVSVFALGPKAVLVQTGRGGEYWEVLFGEDRSFGKTRVDMPLEGTRITLFIAGDRQRHHALAELAREALERWCRHSEAEIWFEDRSGHEGPVPINQPFEVQGDCLVRFAQQGTEIVLAYRSNPTYEFFNKGLTLLSTQDGEEALGAKARRFSQIAFKIKSRYLEHTLSRETILKDENYGKALALLERAADEVLAARLIEELVALAGAERLELAGRSRYFELLGRLAREPAGVLRRVGATPLLRDQSGRPCTPDAVRRAYARDGRIFVAADPSPATRLLLAQGVPVLLGNRRTEVALGGLTDDEVEEGAPGVPLGRPVQAFVVSWMLSSEGSSALNLVWSTLGLNLRAPVLSPGEWFRYDPLGKLLGSVVSPDDVYLAVGLDERPPEPLGAILASAEVLLEEIGAGYRALGSCLLHSPDPDPPVFLVGRELAPLMARAPAGTERGRRPMAAVNRGHPVIRALVEGYALDPAFVVYAVAKQLLLQEDRLLEADARLLELTLARHGGLEAAS